MSLEDEAKAKLSAAEAHAQSKLAAYEASWHDWVAAHSKWLLIGIFAVALLILAVGAFAATPTATVNWGAVTTDENGNPLTSAVGYNVYQGPKGAEAKVANNISATSYAPSSGLVAGTTVCWFVTAVNAAGESAPSNEACKSFPAALPSAPTNVTVN